MHWHEQHLKLSLLKTSFHITRPLCFVSDKKKLLDGTDVLQVNRIILKLNIKLFTCCNKSVLTL
jgi:hypothetical protein